MRIFVKKNFIGFILFGFPVICAFAACNPNAEPTPVAGRHPFRMEITGEDGIQVTWEGYTDGYEPGVTEQSRFAIQNNSDQLWFGRICILLLMPNQSRAMQPLGEIEFTLAPGVGFYDSINFELPSDHPSGTDGLTVVVQRPTGPTVNVTPIQVGKASEAWSTDPWLSEAALDTCQ